MIPAFLSTFGGALPAFFTVAAALAFLRQSGNRRLVPAVQWGIALSIVFSAVTAWIAAGAINLELWEGMWALAVAASLGVLLVFVRASARRSRGEPAGTLVEPAHAGWLWVAFLAFTVLVLTRRGTDIALLMATLVFQVRALDVTVAAASGTVVAALAAWLWSRHAHHLRPTLFIAMTVSIWAIAAFLLTVEGIGLIRVGLADMSGVVR